MAKAAAWVVSVVGGFSLQGAASEEAECPIDLNDTWYSQKMVIESGSYQPLEIVQVKCDFTVTTPDTVFNGTVSGTRTKWQRTYTASLATPEGWVNSTETDHDKISWPWHDTWYRHCPGDLVGTYRVKDSPGERVSVQLNRGGTSCTLYLEFVDREPRAGHNERHPLFSAKVTDDLELVELGGNGTGALLSRGLLSWEGVELQLLRPTPCFDHEMFEPEATMDEHTGLSRTCSQALDDYRLEQEHTVRYPGFFNFNRMNGWLNYRPDLGGEVRGAYETCSGKYELDGGEDFVHSMNHMSNACCRDRRSVCDVKGQPKATPCFEPADFDPTAIISGRTCGEVASLLPLLPGLYNNQTTENSTATGAMAKCKVDEMFSSMVQGMKDICCNGKPSICDVMRHSKCVTIPASSYAKIAAKGVIVTRCESEV